jgi:hypothetical protein
MTHLFSLTVAGAAPELPCREAWCTGFPFHPEYGDIQGTCSKIEMLPDFREGFPSCQENIKLSLINKKIEI